MSACLTLNEPPSARRLNTVQRRAMQQGGGYYRSLEMEVRVDVDAAETSASDWFVLTAGNRHTCGVKDDRTLWCWGRNSAGELGLGHQIRLGSGELKSGGFRRASILADALEATNTVDVTMG